MGAALVVEMRCTLSLSLSLSRALSQFVCLSSVPCAIERCWHSTRMKFTTPPFVSRGPRMLEVEFSDLRALVAFEIQWFDRGLQQLNCFWPRFLISVKKSFTSGPGLTLARFKK